MLAHVGLHRLASSDGRSAGAPWHRQVGQQSLVTEEQLSIVHSGVSSILVRAVKHCMGSGETVDEVADDLSKRMSVCVCSTVERGIGAAMQCVG